MESFFSCGKLDTQIQKCILIQKELALKLYESNNTL